MAARAFVAGRYEEGVTQQHPDACIPLSGTDRNDAPGSFWCVAGPAEVSHPNGRLVTVAGALFKLRLRDGFREPLRHQRFVGRERELALLAELVSERRSATVLVAGFRGAGKTGLVNRALEKAKGKKQLVVRLAPPFLGAEEVGRNSVRAQVLRSLARGLYFAVADDGSLKDPTVRGRIEATYEKTYLMEMETHSVVESVAAAEVKRSESTTVKATLEGSTAAKMLAGAGVMGLVSSAGVGAAVLTADRLGTAWGIGALVVIVGTAVAAGLRIERTKGSDSTATDQVTGKDSRSRVGRLDLSEETLEFELRRSLEDLSKKDYRVIFVLDELDKLEHSSNAAAGSVEDSPVFRIVASLKNFFTLGSAVYIFITDDAFFEHLALTQRDSEYSISHTLFTDRFFVGPLHYSELEQLVDLSLESPPADDDVYDRFKNFVCWEANNHVFDAIQTMSSYVLDEGGSAYLCPSESGVADGLWKEGSLPADWLTRAALQKHVGVAFDEGRRSGPGEALYNQALWESLHLSAQRLLEGEEITIVDDDVLECPGRFVSGLSASDQAGISSAIHRMQIRLERHGAVEERVGPLPSREEPEPPAAGAAATTPGEIEATFYTLRNTVPYPPASIAKEAALLPTEQALLDVVRRLLAIRDKCGELIEMGEDISDGVERAESVAKRVEATGPRRTVQRSIVSRTIPLAGQLAERILRESVDAVIESWADEKGHSYSSVLTAAHPRAPQQQWAQVLAQHFEPVVTALNAVKSKFFVLSGSASDNALLVLALPTPVEADRVAQAYGRCLNKSDKDREQRRLLLPVVHVVLAADATDPMPTELVEVIAEVEAQGFWARLFSSTSSRSRQEPRDLEGWYRFALSADGGNLALLETQLSDASYLRGDG